MNKKGDHRPRNSAQYERVVELLIMHKAKWTPRQIPLLPSVSRPRLIRQLRKSRPEIFEVVLKVLIFIPSKNLPTIRNFIAYENFQDYVTWPHSKVSFQLFSVFWNTLHFCTFRALLSLYLWSAYPQRHETMEIRRNWKRKGRSNDLNLPTSHETVKLVNEQSTAKSWRPTKTLHALRRPTWFTAETRAAKLLQLRYSWPSPIWPFYGNHPGALSNQSASVDCQKKASKWHMHGTLGGKLVHFLLHISAVHDLDLRLIQNLGRGSTERG